jgi:lipopolysaccharide biosynthesis glycosyltransferase
MGFAGKVAFVEADPVPRFGRLRSLHGDWTSYNRLLLPELLSCDKVLCLDTDLLVELDVNRGESIDLSGRPFAAAEESQVQWQLESNFYINRLGLDAEGPAFNGGVLLFDLARWRREKLTEECLRFGHRYPTELRSVDQAILIGLFSRNFARLPAAWNRLWYHNRDMPDQEEERILHFLGSPKPWDLFGWALHRGFKRWAKNRDTGQSMFRDYITRRNWTRAWRVKKSYARVLLRR